MRKPADLTGQRFGKLLVLELVDSWRSKDTNRYNSLWRCKCDCGKEIIVRREALSPNGRKSCGCLVAETARKRRKDPAEMIGLRFGRLVVTGEAGSRRYGSSVVSLYSCKCNCGNTAVVSRHALLSGNTKSCGCLLVEWGKEIGRRTGGMKKKRAADA